jgi:BirA family transcriptional regulator, biotin operon repressor / biotin---[acetyl-CoA-carboxylase] ligase
MLSSINTNIGCNHIHLTSVDSTNTFAKNLIAKSNPIEGTVISTDFQTDGKGQFDRKWLSNPAENIMMSIILTPHFLDISRQAILNMAIALGILDYFKSKNITGMTLKWPNDLYYNNQKIGGILIQNQLQGSSIKHSIVGIGLNINQITFSPDLSNRPTSLAIITSSQFSLEAEMRQCWQSISIQYEKVKDRTQHFGLMRTYNKALYRKGKQAQITLLNNQKTMECTIGEVDLLGRLNVLDTDGRAHVLEHGGVGIEYML